MSGILKIIAIICLVCIRLKAFKQVHNGLQNPKKGTVEYGSCTHVIVAFENHMHSGK